MLIFIVSLSLCIRSFHLNQKLNTNAVSSVLAVLRHFILFHFFSFPIQGKLKVSYSPSFSCALKANTNYQISEKVVYSFNETISFVRPAEFRKQLSIT